MAIDERTRAARKLMGARLKTYRESAGLSAIELAALAKVNRTMVHKIESGNHNFTIDMFAKLLSNCGVPLAEFLTGLRQSDLRDDEEKYYRMLRIILDSQIPEQVNGIHTNLEAISEKVVRLQRARSGPLPLQGVGKEAQRTEGKAAGSRTRRFRL